MGGQTLAFSKKVCQVAPYTLLFLYTPLQKYTRVKLKTKSIYLSISMWGGELWIIYRSIYLSELQLNCVCVLVCENEWLNLSIYLSIYLGAWRITVLP